MQLQPAATQQPTTQPVTSATTQLQSAPMQTGPNMPLNSIQPPPGKAKSVSPRPSQPMGSVWTAKKCPPVVERRPEACAFVGKITDEIDFYPDLLAQNFLKMPVPLVWDRSASENDRRTFFQGPKVGILLDKKVERFLSFLDLKDHTGKHRIHL